MSQKKKVVLKFGAEWCGPCHRIAPFFHEMEKKYPNITFRDIDADEEEELAEEYDISGLPTFVFLMDDMEVYRFDGANEEKLQHSTEKLESLT